MNEDEWKKDPVASGRKGGYERAKRMSKKARIESARHAANTRHERNKKGRKTIPSMTSVM